MHLLFLISSLISCLPYYSPSKTFLPLSSLRSCCLEGFSQTPFPYCAPFRFFPTCRTSWLFPCKPFARVRCLCGRIILPPAPAVSAYYRLLGGLLTADGRGHRPLIVTMTARAAAMDCSVIRAWCALLCCCCARRAPFGPTAHVCGRLCCFARVG